MPFELDGFSDDYPAGGPAEDVQIDLPYSGNDYGGMTPAVGTRLLTREQVDAGLSDGARRAETSLDSRRDGIFYRVIRMLTGAE